MLLIHYGFAVFPVIVTEDSWNTLIYQNKSIIELGLQVKALTADNSWQVNSNYQNLHTLANTLNKIEAISYTGDNINKQFAALYSNFKQNNNEQVSDYSLIAHETLKSSNAILNGLTQIWHNNNKNDPIATLTSLSQANISQAQLTKVGTEVAILEYNALRDLQQVNSMQTQLLAQQLANNAQQELDARRQINQLQQLGRH